MSENEYNHKGVYAVEYSYFYNTEKNLRIDNHNKACFAGLQSMLNSKNFNLKDNIVYRIRIPKGNSKLFFKRENFEKLIRIINIFTPCKIVNLNEEDYIEFKLSYKKYDMNLFLLNFIRLYWYSPRGYSDRIFEKELETMRVFKDRNRMMIRLTSAQKKAIQKNLGYNPGHSNVRKSFKPINYDWFETFNNKSISSIDQFFE